MSTRSHGNRSTGNPVASLATWALTVPLVIVGLAVGLWFFGGVVAPGYWTSIILGFAWFVLASVLIGLIAKRRPGLKAPMRTTFIVVAVVSAVGFYWTSIRDDRVDEVVAIGVPASQVPGGGAPPSEAPVPAATPVPTETPAPAPPAASNIEVARGAFETRAHSSRGTAAVVDLADGGSKLTFTDFATDNGPDLRVYLVRGGDVDDFVDLGRLKGNVGNQQYAIPNGTDVGAYSTVVIWCRAFSVSFAEAKLRAS